MKYFSRVLLFILALMLSLACLAGCSDKDVPDNYQLIARNGDTFRLYVPTQGWMSNTGAGVTSAYFSVSNSETGYPSATVSVYIPNDATGCESVPQYFDICKERLSAELSDFKCIESEFTTSSLDGEKAWVYVYTAKENTGTSGSVEYKYMQVMAMHKEQIYVLLMSAPVSEYESRAAEMNGNSEDDDLGIIGYFRFADAYVGEDDKKYDKDVDVPSGMALASEKGRPYLLFCPESWNVDSSASITSVYTEDRSNLTVQYTMPSEKEHSVQGYWDSCVEDYGSIMSDVEVENKKSITVSGIEGCIVGDIRGRSGGVDYKFRQVIVLKGEIYYVITYTATAENFESHLSDVDKMIEHFSIK